MLTRIKSTSDSFPAGASAEVECWLERVGRADVRRQFHGPLAERGGEPDDGPTRAMTSSVRSHLSVERRWE